MRAILAATILFLTIAKASADPWPTSLPRRAIPCAHPLLSHSYHLPGEDPRVELVDMSEEGEEAGTMSRVASATEKTVAITVNCAQVRVLLWKGFYRFQCFDGKVWGISQVFLSMQDVVRTVSSGEPDMDGVETTLYFTVRSAPRRDTHLAATR